MKKICIALAATILLTSCSFFDTKKAQQPNNQTRDDGVLIAPLNNENPTDVKYLEVNTSSVKKVYEIDEEFDDSNILVFKHLNNGERVPCYDFTVTNVDTSEAGIKSVVVRYDVFFASFTVIVKGFVYHNYDEKYVYFLGETFNKELFSLYKYDENGEHVITDYNVSFPDNSQIGLGQIVITYEDFVYRSDIAILKKQDNVPTIFSSETNNKLLLFVNNIHSSTFKGNPCSVSEGNYLLVKEDGSLALYDFRYMLLQPLNASYFGCSSFDVTQRLIPGGDLLVTINGEHFIIEASIWHHTVIGW